MVAIDILNGLGLESVYNNPMQNDLLLTLQTTSNLLWGQYRKTYKRIGNFPTIQLNNRFTSTAGVCIAGDRIVQLSSKFLVNNYAEMVTDTLPHELAHQIDVDLYGFPKNNRWHGLTWKQIVIELQINTTTRHSMKL